MSFKFPNKLRDERELNTAQWVKERVASKVPITLEEWRTFRMNSWEREALYPLLDNEALIDTARHFKSNCKPPYYGKATTYDETLVHVILPIILKRLEDQL